MREYDFTLILDIGREITEADAEALYASGCDDATVATRHGATFVTFSRQGESLAEAVISAIKDVVSSGVCQHVLRVDGCHLVTPAEIARRIGRTRSLVGQYIAGARGPGHFPAAVCNIVEGHPLWRWCEVSYWLSENDIIKPDETYDAQTIEAINNWLEWQFLKRAAPELASQTEALLDNLSEAT